MSGQECNHTHEVQVSYIGDNNERRVLKLCEACAAMHWNKLADFYRQSYTIEIITEALT